MMLYNIKAEDRVGGRLLVNEVIEADSLRGAREKADIVFNRLGVVSGGRIDVREYVAPCEPPFWTKHFTEVYNSEMWPPLTDRCRPENTFQCRYCDYSFEVRIFGEHTLTNPDPYVKVGQLAISHIYACHKKELEK